MKRRDAKSPIRAFWRRIREQWKPKELKQPRVDPELAELDSIERSAEVTRYSILSLEWWLSPKGGLREWLRLHSKLGCLLLIPALLLLPVITFILAQIAGWVGSLLSIVTHFILLPLAALVALAVVLFAVAVIRSFRSK